MPKTYVKLIVSRVPEVKSVFENFGLIGKKVNLRRTKGEFSQVELTSLPVDKHAILVTHIRDLSKKLDDFSFAFIPANPKIEAAFFDMDATVIKQESIVELAKFAGVSEKVNEITEMAMAGELDFAEALTERVKTLKGLSTEIFNKVISTLTLQPFVEDLIRALSKLNVPSFLVSGGFIQLARPLSTEIGILEARANSLGVQGDRLTGTVEGKIIDAEEKKKFIFEMAEKHNFSPGNVLAIGDGANDSFMLGQAHISVGYLPKTILLDQVDILNRTNDHRFVLDVLNIATT